MKRNELKEDVKEEEKVKMNKKRKTGKREIWES